MIKAVVFDLDHTLFDRYATFKEMILNTPYSELPFKESLSKEQIIDLMIYADKHYIYYGWDRVIEYYKSANCLSSAADTDSFFNKYIAPMFLKFAVPFDYAIPTLNTLKSMGLKIGLITNGSIKVQSRKLEMLKLDNIFDRVLISEEVGENKPHRKPFDVMAQRLNLPANEIAYAGDNPINDIMGAQNAGYLPIWVKTVGDYNMPALQMPEYQVETVKGIPDIINRINGGN